MSRLLSVSFVVIGAIPLLAEAPPRAEIAVMTAAAHALSNPARDLTHVLPAPAAAAAALRKPGGGGPGGGGGGGSWTDGDLQTGVLASAPATNFLNFDGIGANGSIPPDTNLAVGDSQVVEIVNTEFAVYDKGTGVLQTGPVAIHSIFGALPASNLCATSDGGDPIVLYDQLAKRWLISQLAYNKSLSTTMMCIAVSQTSDASGAYNAYAFNFGSNFPDYPKFGVWPDAYYFSANTFKGGASFLGAQACAFDRTKMLTGDAAATVICFQGTSSLESILPANLDGATGAKNSTALPAAGEPNFFMQFVAPGTLNLYQFHVDFGTPAHSTFTGPTNLAVNAFHEACGGGACVPQPGVREQLDSLGDRLMYRLSYRNFGSYESLLVNHSVQVSSAGTQTGIRWYEIRSPQSTPTVYQQSTYSPDSSTYRWMGSIAQDKQGNMFLGYSTSSSLLSPSGAFTGRLAGDPKNEMQAESSFFPGHGSQTKYNRWGDYSSAALDPADDCTFWYANEYLPSTGVFNWSTRLGSFKFGGCK
jgi:hypothetical protein